MPSSCPTGEKMFDLRCIVAASRCCFLLYIAFLCFYCGINPCTKRHDSIYWITQRTRAGGGGGGRRLGVWSIPCAAIWPISSGKGWRRNITASDRRASDMPREGACGAVAAGQAAARPRGGRADPTRQHPDAGCGSALLAVAQALRGRGHGDHRFAGYRAVPERQRRRST